MKKYIPNILTSTRIFLTPVFLYFLLTNFTHGKLIALLVFIIASITDAYDGFFARKYNVVTKFGIFFDPLADKLLVLSAFVGFVFIPILSSDVKLWMIILISFRDILVTALRILMQYKGITMITSKLGKIKTTLQIVTIISILLYLIFNSYNIEIINFISEFQLLYSIMVLTTLVTFYTGLHYFYHNYRTLGQLLFHK